MVSLADGSVTGGCIALTVWFCKLVIPVDAPADTGGEYEKVAEGGG